MLFQVGEIVLGYKVSSKGLEGDKAKKEIKNLPPSINVKDIKSFLG